MKPTATSSRRLLEQWTFELGGPLEQLELQSNTVILKSTASSSSTAFWSSWASQSNTVFLKANASASSTAYWSSWTSQSNTVFLKPTASSKHRLLEQLGLPVEHQKSSLLVQHYLEQLRPPSRTPVFLKANASVRLGALPYWSSWTSQSNNVFLKANTSSSSTV